MAKAKKVLRLHDGGDDVDELKDDETPETEEEVQEDEVEGQEATEDEVPEGEMVESPMDDGVYSVNKLISAGRCVHMLVPVGGDKSRKTLFYAMAQVPMGPRGPVLNLQVYLQGCRSAHEAFEAYESAVEQAVENIKEQARAQMNRPQIVVPGAQIPPELQPGMPGMPQ